MHVLSAPAATWTRSIRDAFTICAVHDDRLIYIYIANWGTLLLSYPVKWFRGGLVCEVHRLLYHSTLGLRVVKERRRTRPMRDPDPVFRIQALTECRKSLAHLPLHGPGLTSANVMRNCVLCNEIYHTHSSLLLALLNRVVISIATRN